jgi:tetratricopeptide (TPR) repeat protein
MKRIVWVIAGMCLLLLAGCGTPRKASEEAQAKWQLARNKIYFQVALEDYQNGKFDECKSQLNRILGAKEPFGPACLLAAKVAMKEQRYEEARQYLEMVTHVSPNSAEAWYGQALLKEMDGSLDAALEALSKAQVLEPNDPEYLVCLAELYVKRGDAQKALATLAAHEARFSNNVNVQSALADLYMMAGNYEASIVCLRRIMCQDPGNADTRERLALALARNHQAELAAPMLETLTAKGGRDKLALRAALADCYMQMRKYAEAEGAYADLCAVQPGNIDWNFRLAECYAMRNDDAAALGRLLQVLEFAPQHADARALAGYLCYAKGDLKDAEEHLRKAIDKASDPTLAAVVLVKTLRALGRDGEADEVWAEFGKTVQTAKAKGAIGSMATVPASRLKMNGPALELTDKR